MATQVLPVARGDHGERFFVRQDGRFAITPLFLVLLVVESTDVIFAVDSVPAIFIITQDPFIVFTSNIFAILGLRALYFLLAGVMDLFRYLKYGLAAILVFLGLKMIGEFVAAPVFWARRASRLASPVASNYRGTIGRRDRGVAEGRPTPGRGEGQRASSLQDDRRRTDGRGDSARARPWRTRKING